MSRQMASPLRLAAGGLLALGAAMGLGRFVYTPILPDMVAAGALDGESAGYVAAANYLGYLAGALLAATSLVSGRRTTWIVWALFATALSNVAMAGVGDETAFAVLRFIGGLASAFVLVFATAVVMDGLALAGRPQLSALHFAGVGIGIVLSALLVHELRGADLWPQQWLVSGLFMLAAAAAAPFLIREAGPGAAQSGFSAGQLALDRRLGALVLAYGLVGFGYVITATFIVAITRNTAGLAAYETAVWVAVGIAAIPSVLLWSRLSARIGVLAAFAAACLVEAAGVIVSVVTGHPAGVLFAAACLGGTFVALTAMGLVAARQLPVEGGAARDARRVVALMTAGFGAGQVVGPAFAGALFAQTGSYATASWFAAAALAVSASIVVWILAGQAALYRVSRTGGS